MGLVPWALRPLAVACSCLQQMHGRLAKNGYESFNRPLLAACARSSLVAFTQQNATSAESRVPTRLTSPVLGDKSVEEVVSSKVRTACGSLRQWSALEASYGLSEEIRSVARSLSRWSDPHQYLDDVEGNEFEDVVINFLGHLAKFGSVELGTVADKTLDSLVLLLMSHRVARYQLQAAAAPAGEMPPLIQECDLKEVVEEAIEDCSRFCVEKNGATPAVEVKVSSVVNGEEKATMDPVVCIPSHMHYIVVEILKNSMQSHIRRFTSCCVEDAKPIDLSLSDRDGWISLKVEDYGIGLSPTHIEDALKYFATSVQGDEISLEDSCHYSGSFGAVFSGLGVGLRMAKLQARHSFYEGDVVIASTGEKPRTSFEDLLASWKEANGEEGPNNMQPDDVSAYAEFSFNSNHPEHQRRELGVQ